MAIRHGKEHLGGELLGKEHGALPRAVVLDGRAVHDYQVRETNGGTEVTVSTTAGHHTLIITG